MRYLTPAMAPISVFHYRDARAFLKDWHSHQQRLDPKFSVRRWAKKMEISHALLVMLLNGKRPLLIRHASAIALGMDLSTPERLYLQTLIELQLATSESDVEKIEGWLETMNPGRVFQIREIDEFKILSGWIHFAILAFLDTSVAIREVDAVAPHFSHLLSKDEITSAFTRLFNHGLITRDLTGRFQTKYGRVTSKDDLASRGAREYFKQISPIAVRAVDEQTVLQREFQSFSLAVDPKKIPLAKEMIRNFRSEFEKVMQSEQATEVYQTNLQFFRLTRKEANHA